MPYRMEQYVIEHASRFLAGDADADHDADHHGEEHHSEFGVHVTYDDIYYSLLFLTAIYVSGQIAAHILRMPSLVGEIAAGIILGPPLAGIVPIPQAFVLLGEIGLLLLVIEAGIDIDLGTLKLIGARGVIIAFLGSIFPIGIGVMLALALGIDMKGAIATGASFGPTSLGIALNILRSGGILNTPVGQLIISAAVIDDMIALVVLSQLRALTGEVTVASVLIPVMSALGFLLIGGFMAIYVLPPIISKYILSRFPSEVHDKLELLIMFSMLLLLMPATFYAKASFLMGAFVAGLTFCSSHTLHHIFVTQFKRLLQWLMRIFFAASIGFQVPVKQFGSGEVIWKGLFLTLALTGKLAAGLLVPNFSQARRFKEHHLRDCLVTGLSLAAEGEFAFVIAVFAVDAGLIDVSTYSSIVLAVLLSTIVPPFLLRYTIQRYNAKSAEAVRMAAELEMHRGHDLESQSQMELRASLMDEELEKHIRNRTVVFLCIQTQSFSRWGLLTDIMQELKTLELDTIDHRSWHPRGINTTLVNEIYCKNNLDITEGDIQELLENRIKEIQQRLEDTINQPSAKVKVTRWYPGVVNEIVEEVEEKTVTRGRKRRASIQEEVLKEAQKALEVNRALQMQATQSRSLQELSGEIDGPTDLLITELSNEPKPRKRRLRQKMRSTPIFGGSLFGEETGLATKAEEPVRPETALASFAAFDDWKRRFEPTGQSGEITVNGETFNVRISEDTIKNLRKGSNGESTLDGRGIISQGLSIDTASSPVVNMLQGFVRNQQLTHIQEERHSDIASDDSDMRDLMRPHKRGN